MLHTLLLLERCVDQMTAWYLMPSIEKPFTIEDIKRGCKILIQRHTEFTENFDTDNSYGLIIILKAGIQEYVDFTPGSLTHKINDGRGVRVVKTISIHSLNQVIHYLKCSIRWPKNADRSIIDTAFNQT